jgi:hypothetical protein
VTPASQSNPVPGTPTGGSELEPARSTLAPAPAAQTEASLPAESPVDDRSPKHRNTETPVGLQPSALTKTLQARGSLTRLLLFFLLLALSSVALHVALNHAIKNVDTSSMGVFNRVMAGKVNAQILITGSSRALSHYDPRVIQNLTGKTAYNIGRNASHIDLQLALLKVYLEKNAKPELVIQNLDLFSLQMTPLGEIYEPAVYVPYLGNTTLYDALSRINPHIWKWKFFPLYAYCVEDMKLHWINAAISSLGVRPAEDHLLGFNPRNADWNQDFEAFRAANPNGVTFRIESQGVTALEEFIRLCQLNGIRIVLVYSPEYDEMQAMEVNRTDVISRFSALATSTGVPFWDYSDHPISLNRELFQNSQHLNAEGAARFSLDLAGHLTDSMVLR